MADDLADELLIGFEQGVFQLHLNKDPRPRTNQKMKTQSGSLIIYAIPTLSRKII